MWTGDRWFLIRNLVLKDFRVRYRNMSLGVLWSLLNPIVMLGVLVFVFTAIFRNPQPHFALFVLCGLIPFNFFSLAWSTSTTSILDNASLVKRVPFPREIIPVTAVFSNCIHLVIQIGLLIAVTFLSHVPANIQWLWMPLLWGMEVMFVCGLGLMSAAINVYIRDTRYIVDSANTVLFWLVPIFYGFEAIPPRFKNVFQFNPIAALVLALRDVIMRAQAPSPVLLEKFFAVSCLSLIVGLVVFRRLKLNFYDRL
jgi:homopolymeric O-antigen transport system permease protein